MFLTDLVALRADGRRAGRDGRSGRLHGLRHNSFRRQRSRGDERLHLGSGEDLLAGDRAGRMWQQRTGIGVEWIPVAGDVRPDLLTSDAEQRIAVGAGADGQAQRVDLGRRQGHLAGDRAGVRGGDELVGVDVDGGGLLGDNRSGDNRFGDNRFGDSGFGVAGRGRHRCVGGLGRR